jgi:hypothetical protein
VKRTCAARRLCHKPEFKERESLGPPRQGASAGAEPNTQTPNNSI